MAAGRSPAMRYAHVCVFIYIYIYIMYIYIYIYSICYGAACPAHPPPGWVGSPPPHPCGGWGVGFVWFSNVFPYFSDSFSYGFHVVFFSCFDQSQCFIFILRFLIIPNSIHSEFLYLCLSGPTRLKLKSALAARGC